MQEDNSYSIYTHARPIRTAFLIDPDNSPEELLESGRIGREIQDTLMSIGEDHRAVLVLRHFSECSYRQIAVILQIPEKTVKSRLFTARKHMKLRLRKKGILSA